MPSFSNHSLIQIDTLDERLQALCFEVIEYLDFRVIEGARDEARQNEMADADPPLSHLRWPHGKHNCPDPGQKARAFDGAPWPIDWKDTARFIAFGSFVRGVAVRMGIPIIWGGDWDGDWSFKDQRFHDLGHIELII
jgi:peptidoglycan L-alanyl-D-glutamate endopeptidase CwlK